MMHLRLLVTTICLTFAVTCLVPAPVAESATRTIRLFAPRVAQVGKPVTLTANITPRARGRAVIFQHRVSGTWKRLATKRTNPRGVAKAKVSFGRPGPRRVRVVLPATRRAPKRIAVKTITVQRPRATSRHLRSFAPRAVEPGQLFELGFEVTSGTTTLRDARISVAATGGGRQVTPPDDIRLSSAGTGSLSLGTVASGRPARPRLRWVAPAAPTTLRFTVRLSAQGVSERLEVPIPVVTAATGGVLYGNTLASVAESTEAPTDPDLIVATCTGAGTPGAPVPTFATALAQARAYLNSAINPAYATDWRSLPGQNDVRLLDEVLWIAIADRRPAAALAAALRAHELQPGDGSHLSNAAASASMLDRPGWAIAFAEQAGRVRPAPSVGVRQESARLVNLGHARAQLRDWRRAEQALRQAIAADPHNQQAHAELANILACAGQRNVALPHLRRSLRVDDQPDPLTVEGGGTLRDSSDVFDLSKGVAQSITLPAIPRNWEQLVGMVQSNYYRDQLERMWRRQADVAQRIQDLRAAADAANRQPATQRRTDDILQRVGTHADRKVIDAWADYLEQTRGTISPLACQGTQETHPYCNTTDAEDYACQQTSTLVGKYLVSMRQHLTALAQMHDVVAPRLSGLQAQLTDPGSHELAGLLAEELFIIEQLGVLQNLHESANQFAFYNTWHAGMEPGDPPCVGPAPHVTPPTVTTERVAAPTCAPPTPRQPGIEVDLLVVSLSADCEKFSIGGSNPTLVPWINAFARYDRHGSGGVTANVGLKAEVSGLAFESAFYFTHDARGRVKDFGWQVGPEVSVGQGVKLSVYEDKVRISLMAVFVDT